MRSRGILAIAVTATSDGLESGHLEANMKKLYNIAEAKAHFSELVRLALHGEEVIIARDSKPLVKLAPVTDVKKKRHPGLAKGQILSISPDFDP